MPENITHLWLFVDTAINIGYSCKLLTDELEDVYVIDGGDEEEVEKQLRKCHDEMTKMKASHVAGVTMTTLHRHDNGAGGDHNDVMTSPVVANYLTYEFAIVINGHSLVSVVSSCDWSVN